MERRLFEIIRDGTLVDNQSYLVNKGILTNKRLGTTTLETKSKGQRTTVANDEAAIWQFLNVISYDVEKTLKTETSLKFFNDEEYESNTDAVFTSVSGRDAQNFTLNTGNLIGFVTQGKYSLKISSRFGDAFLKYIIADADGFLELENKGGEKQEEGYEWLLAYLWNIKLKKAYRLGLPKHYTSKNERISSVRGTIDVVDYFQNQTSGKYLCSYREHSYSSLALALFIKAYEKISKYQFSEETRNIYNTFLMANQGEQWTLQEILRAPYFSNPYYNDYNVLIDVSKQVLGRKGSDFDSHQETSAFFFDISMLFEYFIRKLLKRSGIRLHSKFEDRLEIPTGAFTRGNKGNSAYRRKLEPDLVFDHDGGLYILDVKYKAFDFRYGVTREDLFQLHTYIGQYGNRGVLKGCGFVYPISAKRWTENGLDQIQGVISAEITQQAKTIPFHVIFLKVPDNTLTDFNVRMQEQCQMFLETIGAKVLLS